MKKNQTNILMFVLGIAIFLCTYLLVFNRFNDMKDQMTQNNAQLQKEVNYLQDLADNKQQYLDDTEAMKAQNDEIISKFPAEVRPEDEILYVDGVEKNFDAEASSVQMPGSTAVQIAASTPVEATTEETADTNTTDASAETEAASASSSIMLYQTPVTVGFKSSYNSIKDIIKKINEDTEKKSIDQLTLTFDSESGDLAGTISYSMYSMSGTAATYSSPSVSGVTYGTNNIFNSAEKKVAVEKAKAAASETSATETEE